MNLFSVTVCKQNYFVSWNFSGKIDSVGKVMCSKKGSFQGVNRARGSRNLMLNLFLGIYRSCLLLLGKMHTLFRWIKIFWPHAGICWNSKLQKLIFI